ncbi:putative long chain fatty acid-CoA synthetase Faa4p [Mycobacterium intracellulare subsp. chimaera]|nr:putative long chain fatty acid-CoA synthetase Faa4p [Mycobacterium intracellulare subsp. chimaera]
MPVQPTLLRRQASRGVRRQRVVPRVKCPMVGQCFDIEVTRDADGWAITVPEIGRSTRTTSRAAVELAARECIATWTGIPIGYVAVYVVSEIA